MKTSTMKSSDKSQPKSSTSVFSEYRLLIFSLVFFGLVFLHSATASSSAGKEKRAICALLKHLSHDKHRNITQHAKMAFECLINLLPPNSTDTVSKCPLMIKMTNLKTPQAMTSFCTEKDVDKLVTDCFIKNNVSLPSMHKVKVSIF
ncbi:uncharacterized protein LOC141852450 [Brevipalpus obovatus]|uniref:uncharacterized protein LOC141852450 n=1 Tax=Brevipalpus obovatus TaxID=246614 RepID=UPI003D9E6E60